MSKLELSLVIALHRANNKLDRKTSRLVGEYNLSLGQFGVLEALYHKGNLTVGQVQEKILSTIGTIPMIVSNFVDKGLIRRCKDKKDKRKCILKLTPKGKKLIAEVFPKNEELILQEMQVLSDEEKTVLLELLKKLSMDNLQADTQNDE